MAKANEQIMRDYKSDLETLKQGMRSKAKEDELLFNRVLEEKRNFTPIILII